MPSPADAVCSALSQSLAADIRKGKARNGAASNFLDIAIASASKLAEVTRCTVDYEAANCQRPGTLSMLKSKYVVLDSKVSNGTQNGNNHGVFHDHMSNGNNQDLDSRGSVENTSGNASRERPNGLCSSVKSVSQNGLNHGKANTAHLVSNGLANSTKKMGCNGVINGTGGKGTGLKTVASSEPVLAQPKQVLFDSNQIKLGLNVKVGAGMINLGNTCYLNATLQALFHVPAFAHWLSKDTEHRQKCDERGHDNDCVICAMAKTLELSSTQNVIKPFLIHNKMRIICRQFSHGAQEDASEFMRHLLENMGNCYLKRFKNYLEFDNLSKETTPIHQIFGGYLRNEVRCRKCNYASTTFQHFQDLILDVKKASKVEDAMEQHFSYDVLDGENSYTCEKCKMLVVAHKKFSIEKPPKVLCIQLKRFNGNGGKLNKTVEHRLQMDIKKFVHPNSEYAKYPNLQYRLISMVSHLGQSSSNGHYIAVALGPSSQFHIYDDAQVHPITKSIVMNTSAYILIYEMEPNKLKSVQKPVTASLLASSPLPVASSNVYANGVNKHQHHTMRSLPTPKDRDRVSFGFSPQPINAQPPRIIFNTKKNDLPTLGHSSKPSIAHNSTSNGETRSNFIGPVQASNGMFSMANNSTPMVKNKSSGLASSKQSNSNVGEISRKDAANTSKAKETGAKTQGPLVPYDCNDDSRSRESSLSPPLIEEQEEISVKATRRDWQVTNSSGLLSPSINSECSFNTGASATGTSWSVTEEPPALHTFSSTKIKDVEANQSESISPHKCKFASDVEDSRSSKSAKKTHSRAKSVESTPNPSIVTFPSKEICSIDNFNWKRGSFSSVSDSSSSSECETKRSKVSGFYKVQSKAVCKRSEIEPVEDIRQVEDKVSNHSHKSAANGRLQQSLSESSQGREKNFGVNNSSRHFEPPKTWNGDARSDTVSELKTMSHQGFGSQTVLTWNGERSQMSRKGEDFRQEFRKRPLDDYEADLDRGRVKKFKRYNETRWPSTNHFQNYHSKVWSSHQNNRNNNRPYPVNRGPRYRSNKAHMGFRNGDSFYQPFVKSHYDGPRRY